MTTHTTSILIVEDDPGYARLIKDMLQDAAGSEFSVLHADLLMKGINLLAENDIDLIILDLTLPDSEGIDTFLRIKGVTPELPVIVLSSMEDEKVAVHAVTEGAQDYLFKVEMRPALLVRSIRYAMERKRIRNQLKNAHDELEERVNERTQELTSVNEQLKTEITERKRYEAALKENEQLFKATIESIGDGIFVVGENGEVTHSNERFVTLWQIPRDLFEKRNDELLLEHFLGMLEEPKGFLSTIKELYHTTNESLDLLKLKDGRTLERYTHPLTRNGKFSGRVWRFKDITDRVEAERRISESEERFRGITERSFDVIYEFDDVGAFTYISPAVFRITGFAPDELIGKPLHTLFSQSADGQVTAMLERIETGNSVEGMELEAVKKDGREVSLEINSSPIFRNGVFSGGQGIARDVSDRKAIEEQMRILSITDTVTGLFNQTHFAEKLRDEVKRALRSSTPLSLVVYHIDNLAEYNETHGRLKGDRMLSEIGKLTRKSIREDMDTAFRYGSDDFALVLPHTRIEDAESIANRIVGRIQKNVKEVSLSVGLAPIEGRKTADDMIQTALKDLNARKKAAS